MKKVTIIMIMLLSVMIAGCSSIYCERQEDNGIAIEQQTKKENQSIQSTDAAKEDETFIVTDYIVDYSDYFQGISGCAVIYDPSISTYLLYDKEKCETEVSPLSTFKIVSALAGLENEVLENDTSTMEYSGIKYPIGAWNSNLTLKEAFETSCVWYFRQVVDKVGQKDISIILKELQYGNCDISEWN